MTGPRLADQADSIAAAAQQAVSTEVGRELMLIRERLAEPIRIAVAGRIKAGKSTLVNALLGQLIAPTDVSECTQVVTEFRYGFPQRAEIVMRDGPTVPLLLRHGGRLPDQLGVDPADVGIVRVWLTNDVLQTMTLIDTPGLNSVNTQVSERSQEWLRMDADTRWAAGGADVVLFVVNSAINAVELGMLREHYSAATGSAGSALTALGVLTKADKVGGAGDPWLAACELAQNQARRLRSEVATVLPVLGLLAEAAETFELTEIDAADLNVLAGLGADAPTTMLWSPDHFLAADLPIPVDRRARLLSVLDLYGVKLGIELAAAGICGAVPLREELAERSGLADVRRALHNTFARRGDVLKTYDALNRMDVISYRGEPCDATALARMRAAIEQLRDQNDMHEVLELSALHGCLTGAITLPPPLVQDALRLAGATTPTERCGLAPDAPAAEIRLACAAAASSWKAYSNSGVGTREQAAARVMVGTYSLLFESAGH